MNSDAEAPETNYPKKLAGRISTATPPKEGEFIIGDGTNELRSTRPVHVVEYFLATNKNGWADWTFLDYSYDLTRFLEFCKYAGIDDLADLRSRHLESFKDWRQRDGNIVLATLHGQLANLRVFIRFLERVNIIDRELADAMELPELSDEDIVSYVRILPEQAEAILDYHETFEYASRRHAEFALMWSILCRLGGCRGLDLSNYQEDDEGEKYVVFEHRPDEDTPLKNGGNEAEGKGGEREVNVPTWVADILDDYIEENRIVAIDEYGREPLFTTADGRVSASTLRRDLYRITQPCRHGRDCPHNKDPDDCEARTDNNSVSKCPSSVSPHPVRRGGICHQINEGVPKDTICERADVSRKVLKKHYDLRTKEEARQERRQELKKHLDGYDPVSATESGSHRSKSGGIADHSPFLSDLIGVKNRVQSVVSQPEFPARRRMVNGIAGYAVFVTLTGFNLGLMGIGFNPVTMELILNL